MNAEKSTDQKALEEMGIRDDCEHAEECGISQLERLATAFMASARRWELVVYPSLFMFIILAAYGFYLVYSLTQDAHAIAEDMTQIARQMEAVSRNMVVMTQLMDSQSSAMNDMVVNMRGMNVSINQMRYDMSIMNQSVSRPMSFMNSFMPW